MGYNIDSADILKSDNFRLSEHQFKEWKLAECEGTLEIAEINFLESVKYQAKLMDGWYVYHNFSWGGCWSGHGYEVLKKEFLPYFKGSADIIFTWEGGNSHSGLRVVDGKVTEHEVIMALGDETNG